ncbi:hypothetical protein RJ640_013268 [Escallonia rubra]|uniref:Chalcone-flavonone isomerase family protein n=1 Tax=Escallonia rubra TaxID=112253 RepID=A0AA88UC54_9ASTE|nr:hypothetical protein RJ640_013268 [Escallonia rubra]
MSQSQSVTGVQVESYLFPPTVVSPGTADTFFLGGAGVRGVDIRGKFLKVTAIGLYMEESAIPTLAVKWKGKSAEELMDSVEFFRDIFIGPFEKFVQVTLILPLTGKQYSEKVAGNCVKQWKAAGTYTDAEEKAIEKLLEVFKAEICPPGSSILFTLLSHGSLAISFTNNHCRIPEVANAVIEDKQLGEAVLESIIGKDGVSPAAKKSLAPGLAEFFCDGNGGLRVHGEDDEDGGRAGVARERNGDVEGGGVSMRGLTWVS